MKKQFKNYVYFIERFCYIKDKETNKRRPIKLTRTQKRFIKHLIRIKDEKNFYFNIEKKILEAEAKLKEAQEELNKLTNNSRKKKIQFWK